MTIFPRRVLMIFIISLAAACQRAVPTLENPQAIRDNETKWNQDYAARDIDRLVDHYADNAVLMAPGIPPTVGKKAIRQVLTGMIADPTLSLKFSAARIDVAASGDLGYSQGSYLMTITDPQTKRVVHDYGSYVTMYKRGADGQWKAITDIATSEARPPSSLPPS